MSERDVLIDRLSESPLPDARDLVRLLSLSRDEAQALFQRADDVRRTACGDGILLRALVEFSNRCSRRCFYCGLHKERAALKRYQMTSEEIRACVAQVADKGIKTVVLQSGEDDALDAEWLADVIASLKSCYDIAVTLSCGEKSEEVYDLWRRAGADRYLLKIETSNPALYKKMHPDMSLENRVYCLRVLRDLGYQVGSGSLVGLKGQSLEDLAADIIFFKVHDFDMLGIGPFIPHPQTPHAACRQGDILLTLKMLALTRIMTRNPHMPATTAIGSVEEGRDHRLSALKAGANVVMPNFTPAAYRPLYEIYPHKRCLSEQPGACVPCLEGMAGELGRFLDYGRGDSIRSCS
ncbi:MAG: [FeFe] hydrogenase H-cluster radical SAM maturase HydE [Candidatus Omnitrophota bacterium]